MSSKPQALSPLGKGLCDERQDLQTMTITFQHRSD